MKKQPNKSSEANLTTSQKVYAGLAVLLVLLLTIGGIYYYMNQSQTAPSDTSETSQADDKPIDEAKGDKAETPELPPQPKPQPRPKPQPPKPAPAAFVPSAEFVENTTAVMNTLDTQPLLGHMQDSVKIYYNSSTPATTLGAVAATNTLQYFSDAKTPWNLKLSQAQIGKYNSKPGFDKLFGAGCLTGRSANGGHIVSFCFTPEGKIHSIFLCREPEIFN